MSIEKKIEEFKDDLELFDDELEKYQFIIDLGKKLNPLDEKEMVEENLVQGCTSKVWLIKDVKNNELVFRADSNAAIVKGLVYIITTIFSNENESIASPEEFEITDDIYKQFIDFVKESEFQYDSKSQEELDELIKTAKSEKYYGLATAEFEALQAKLVPDLEKDLKQFDDDIKELLEDEIVSRYYYQKGAIRAALKDDKGIISKIFKMIGLPYGYRGMIYCNDSKKQITQNAHAT